MIPSRLPEIRLALAITVLWCASSVALMQQHAPDQALPIIYERATTLEPPPASVERRRRGLLRSEEVTFTENIKTMKTAVKLREGTLSTQQWAAACDLSVQELHRIVHDGQAARAAVVSANVGLVTKIAQRHHASLKIATEADHGVGTILSLQDMIQEGNMGLLEAAERFDPERGVRFSTYATFWIRQRILRSVSDTSRIIRLPAHVHSMLHKIGRARKEWTVAMGRPPTTAELAKVLSISEKKVKLYADSSRNVVSLERPVRTSASFKEDTRTLGDVLASEAPSPQDNIEAASLRDDIRSLMKTELSKAERAVITSKFGLNDGKSRNNTQIAELLGISKDRVRLLEAKALNKLRHPNKNYKLKDYVVGLESVTSTRTKRKTPQSPKSNASRHWF